MKLVFFLLFIFCPFVFSQNVQVLNCELHYSKDSIKTVKKTYYPTKEIIVNSRRNVMYRYRLALDFQNLTNMSAEGVVFRYSISIKVRKNSSASEGVWMVPFFIDEIRISKISPSSSRRMYVYEFNLQSQFKKIEMSNFEIEAAKIEIMKEPKKEDEKVEVLAYIFPVKKI